VQRADGKGRVRVPLVRLRFLVPRVFVVNVNMDVAFAVMFMRMRVDIVLERAVQRPEADAEKHHADNPVAPRRKQVHRQPRAQPQRKQAHDRDARRMAETPADAGNPGALRPAHRQRRDGRQVVRSRQHVNDAGDQSGDYCNHKFVVGEVARIPASAQSILRPFIGWPNIQLADGCSHTLIDKNPAFFAVNDEASSRSRRLPPKPSKQE